MPLTRTCLRTRCCSRSTGSGSGLSGRSGRTWTWTWTWRPSGSGRCRGASAGSCPGLPAAAALGGVLSESRRAGSRGAPGPPSPGPGGRSQEAVRVIMRKTNRMHMTSDHHGRTACRATLLVTATDEILGTHRRDHPGPSGDCGSQDGCRVKRSMSRSLCHPNAGSLSIAFSKSCALNWGPRRASRHPTQRMSSKLTPAASQTSSRLCTTRQVRPRTQSTSRSPGTGTGRA
jgi:hypothetical protein